MKIPYYEKFELIEREDYANYLFVAINWEGMTLMPKKWGFKPIEYAGAEYIKSACNLFCSKESYDMANKDSFQILFNNPKLWDKLHNINKDNSNKLLKLSKAIKKIGAEKLTNQELIKWIKIFQSGQASVHVPRLPMWLLETPKNIITNYLRNYLEEIYQEGRKIKYRPQEALQILTTPTGESNWMKEKKELSKIAKIKNNGIQNKLLKKHTKKYEWLEYGLQGKILTLTDFEESLEKIKHEDYEKKLKQETEKLLRKQREVEQLYNVGKIS